MRDERVAVLGLGNMGTALARTLLGAGCEVGVWNRTSTKAEALRAEGAIVAESPATAVAESDLVIVCLAEHSMTIPVLESADLAGRCVVQLTAGAPADSMALASWVSARDALFVEGQIMVYPEAIGTDSSRVIYAGSEAALHRARLIMEVLGGPIRLGERVGAVSGLAVAARTSYLVASVAAVLSVEIARAYGASVDALLDEVELLQGVALAGVRDSLRNAEVGTDHVSVSIDRMAVGSVELAEAIEQLGLDSSLLRSAAAGLQRAVDAGAGLASVGHLGPSLRIAPTDLVPHSGAMPFEVAESS